MYICTDFMGIENKGPYYEVKAKQASIAICFITDEIVRVHVSFDGSFENASYILMTTAWEDEMDHIFGSERSRVQPFRPDFTELDNEIILSSDKVNLHIKKQPFQISLYDAQGSLLYSTLPESPFTCTKSGKVTSYACFSDNDCYYGFGEKTGPINKNKCFIRERATDCMGYDPQKADTLYKHIPFYICLHTDTQKAVGVFCHNFSESVFNMGCEKSNYWQRYSYFQAESGSIDMYLLGGNQISAVLDNYTLLTGRPLLLPKRGLGYQGSSMYYPELEKDCDKAILSFIDSLSEDDIPVDGFHLSSGYTSVNDKRCVFTWNNDKFPDPEGFTADMKAKHADIVPNVKPGVLLTHPLFSEFTAHDCFVKDSNDPSKNAEGKWWGGDGIFFDYTNPEGRTLWKELLKRSLLTKGITSIWNDNCEYDSLLDLDAVCCKDGKTGTIGELKPLMSTLMCRLSTEAIQETHPNTRPYIVCRSGSSGIQHYAQTWCGDNYTSWDTLKNNIATILGMGLSGQPNEGADIGGFAGPAPTEELFVRWVQNGIFQPRFSIHSASNDNTVTEPCMFQNSAPLIRDAIKLRYKLTPYIYSLEYIAHETGAPIMRPLVYEFQSDPNVYNESYTFMFGKDLLVANVLDEGAESISVYLPAGCKWYSYNKPFVCYEGGRTIEMPVSLDSIPMFIRENGMLALADNEIMHMASDPVTKLHLITAPSADSKHVLYDDDGVSYNYLQGDYKKTTVTTTCSQDVIRMQFAYEGSYEDSVQDVFIEMIAQQKAPLAVTLDDKELCHYLHRKDFEAAEQGWYYSHTKRCAEIKYANPKKDYTLTTSFEKFDLIGM